MSGKCWESVGACLGYDVVVVRVVVAAERATVYPAVKRVSEVGKVSGWEGKGRVDGASGRFLINGKDAAQANKMVMKPGDRVILKTPGGGGYGAAS